MAKEIKYYIVAAEALPEIFIKVAEAKRMMDADRRGIYRGGGHPDGRHQPQRVLQV